MHASPVYHSRIHESPVFRSMPGIVAAGEVSTGALAFDGTNDYVDCGLAASTNVFGTGWSFSGWVFPTVAQIGGIYAKGVENGNGGAGEFLYIWSNRTIQLYNSGGGTRETSNGVLPLNAWSHVAVTIDGTNVKFYINGSLDVSRSNGGFPVTAASYTTRIGRESTGGFYFAGALDDIRIYSGVLTAPQIAAMYANTTPAPTAGLVGHWKFDEGSGTTAVDSSGNGNNGTLTNGPTWEVQVPPRLSRNRNTEDWSVSLDGTNDHVAIPYNLPASVFTLSMWAKSSSDRTQGLFTSGPIGSGTPFLLLRRLIGGVITVYTPNSYYSTSSSVTNNNDWFHLVVVRNGSSGALYINGKNVLSLSYSAGGSNVGTYLGVDAFATNNYWLGLIKDTRVYNSALAQSDITKLCNGQESTAVPVAQWRLNDGSGTNANDEIGTNDGTLTNGPTWSSQVPPWFVA